MLKITEVKTDRILNPTSIDLGEYVINPYVGCEYACLYCYVRSNKTTKRRKTPWGDYVDIRSNSSELLQKEILEKKPKTILLGSTTECFQPVEKGFHLTGKLLEILNSNGISYVILTRSPYIVEYIPLLSRQNCKAIYFTVNNFNRSIKQYLEPNSPSFESRNTAVEMLIHSGLPVIPYYSPVIPWVSDIEKIFYTFDKARKIEFECLNFRLNNILEIVNCISFAEPLLKDKFYMLLNDRLFYEQTWSAIEMQISGYARHAQKECKIHRHDFDKYFQNTYSSGSTSI
jgi:DNA repair photolyase